MKFLLNRVEMTIVEKTCTLQLNHVDIYLSSIYIEKTYRVVLKKLYNEDFSHGVDTNQHH